MESNPGRSAQGSLLSPIKRFDPDLRRSLLVTSLPAAISIDRQNFARSVKWCPDGLNALFQCENHNLLLSSIGDTLSEDVSFSWRIAASFPSPLVDYTWYPTASLADPASFCFVASVRDCPVKLLDASDGRVNRELSICLDIFLHSLAWKLRASYKLVDHRERYVAPHSLAFNLTCNKLYCGFEDAIEVFDISMPGEGYRLHTRPSKTSKDGLRGIISTIAFSSQYDLFAAGSLAMPTQASSNIGIFSESSGQDAIMFVGVEDAGVQGSATQVMFNPTQPHLLYAAFRRSSAIASWDIRGDVSTPLQLYCKDATAAPTATNQKFKFHVDSSGQWMVSGDQMGNVHLFALQDETREITREPSSSFSAHHDAVGSVEFHPTEEVLLSVSGSRHFSDSLSESEESNSMSLSGSSDDGDDEGPGCSSSRMMRRSVLRPRDASIKLWKFH